MKVGVVGAGGIGLAYAAWMADRGHSVSIWSPRLAGVDAASAMTLTAGGVLTGSYPISQVVDAQALALDSEIIVITVPLNGHRRVMDALLPHLRSGQRVIVSSMGSLSSLYLYEQAQQRGIDIRVASFGSTALTARRKQANEVNIMTRRPSLGVSCLPFASAPQLLTDCEALFGNTFTLDENPLVSTLANTNAISHAPLALCNWTRIERAEAWPQYHYMTPRVAAVIEQLDSERMAVAQAFGWTLPSVKQKLSRSFGIEAEGLAGVAAALHAKRGGPPGPVDVATRYLSEDVPFGLVFVLALGQIAKVPMPATAATVAMSSLVVGEDFTAGNDLIDVLRISTETVEGLLQRVSGD
ncbi:NAD/NADP octopine/nopaline dehydrogenase [Pigmentiphaga aceris]|uniref:NAD/NADP octopine/nopaline dehydrogenase n=2 Tax=Pigmentiphaga aceris TaxID=1940612 RepID=A0A5C0B735_9BURK|nr:NAD/NADP octopine/nopaline dehydrogenase [Pigmentiphaga aceris]